MNLKLLLLAFLLSATISGFAQKKSTTHQNSLQPPGVSLSGIWLDVTFLKTLRETRSLSKALNAGYPVLYLDKTLKGSLGSFHESPEFMVSSKAGKKKGTFKANYTGTGYNTEIGYNKTKAALVLYNYADNVLKDSVVFTRVSSLMDDYFPFNYINNIVLAGSYMSGDQKVTFTNDGHVIGLGDHKTYRVKLEETFDFSHDHVIIDTTIYVYSFENGILNLSPLIKGSDGSWLTSKPGPVEYRLTYQAPPQPSKTTEQVVGGDRDKHGCIGSAGYSWSQVKNTCVKIWEAGIQLTSVPSSSQAAYIIFSADKQKVEVFLPSETTPGSFIMNKSNGNIYSEGKYKLTTTGGYILLKDEAVIYNSKQNIIKNSHNN